MLFVAALQWASPMVLLALAALSTGLAVLLAPDRGRKLLRRTRWLLLSLAVLFVFFTPGEFLPGVIGQLGITYEGLSVAAEHLARLIVILTSLALLHERLGTAGLMAGLYSLLAPIPRGKATVVRLMLVLESIERKPVANWRAWLEDVPGPGDEGKLPETCRLEVGTCSWRDRALVAVALLAMLWLVSGK